MSKESKWPIKAPNSVTKMSVVNVMSTAVNVKDAFGSFRAYKKKREEVSSIRKSASEPDLPSNGGQPTDGQHGVRRRCVPCGRALCCLHPPCALG